MADAQIKITADASQATGEISKLDKALGSLGNASSTVKSIFATLTAAAAGVGYAMAKVVQATGELNDTAAILGISASNLNVLQKAAQLAGVSSEELTKSLFKLNQNIGDALVKGTGPANDALKRLGLSAQQLASQSLDQTFEDVTKALAKIENPAVRASTAMDLFGKTGAKITQVTAAADAFRKKMEDLGLSLKDFDQQASNIDAIGDSFEAASSVIEASFQKALSALAPYLISFARTVEQVVGYIVKNWENILPILKIVGLALAALAVYIAPIPIAVAAFAAAIIALAPIIGPILNKIFGYFDTYIIQPIIKSVRLVYALGAAMVALAQGKNPFEAYNKAIKAFDGVKVFGDVKTIQTELNVKAEEEKKTREATKAVVTGINEEQQKILDNLTKSVNEQRLNNEYLRNRLVYGDEEAKKMKLVADFNQKIKDAKIAITPQVQKQLDLLRQSNTTEADTTDELTKQLKLRDGIRGVLKSGEADPTAGLQSILKYSKFLSEYIDQAKQAKDIGSVFGGLISPDGLAMNAENAQKGMYQKLPVIQKEIYDKLGIQALDDTGQLTQKELAIYRAFYNELRLADEYAQTDMAIKSATIKDRVRLDNINREVEDYKGLFDLELGLYQTLEERKAQVAQEYADKKLQIDINRIQKTMMAEKDLSNFVFSEKDRQVLQAVGQQERQQKSVNSQIEFEKKSVEEKTQFVIQQGANAFNALGAQNKKAFEIAKAFNIANAIMNTFVGASAALRDYPPPFSFIAAAAQVAFGLAQVAQIRSQTYSGRALGGPMVGGQGYLVGEKGPEIFTPSTAGTMTPNDQLGGGATNVTFNIIANDTKGFDQLLMQRKGMITKIISDAQLEKGRRQI